MTTKPKSSVTHFTPAEWLPGMATAGHLWCGQPWKGTGRIVVLVSCVDKVTCKRCLRRLGHAL